MRYGDHSSWSAQSVDSDGRSGAMECGMVITRSQLRVLTVTDVVEQ